MTRDTWLKYFDASAEPVQAYLLDEASADAETRAQEQLHYEHDAWDRIMNVIWDAVFTDLDLVGFQQAIRPLVGDRDPVLVERVLSLELLYPLADLLAWDLDARLQQLGSTPSPDQAKRRISLRPVSYGAAVKRIAQEARISLLGDEVVRRLRDVFVSYVNRVRTIEQVTELLRRSTADGGMGWSSDQAQAFLTASDSLLRRVPVMSEEEYSRWFQQQQREAISEKVRQTVSEKRQAANGAVDEMASTGPRVPILPPSASLLDRAVEEAYVLTNVQGLDDYLKKRLRNVISTRLRGVRSVDQAREVLLRDAKVGGLGQTQPETERILAVIDQMYTEYHEKIESEEHKKVEAFVEDQEKRIQDRQQKDSADREAWYQEKLQSVTLGETGAVSALKAMMNGVQMAGPTCEVTPGGVRISMEGGAPNKNQLDGVQGYARLSSLTEQLETMDVARFRRMAKTPEEAQKKVMQMFQALNQESYDRWIEGIKRWRQSPLQQEYLRVVTQAFAEQRPISEVVQMMQQTPGTVSLTPEEVGVIINLNQALVF